MSRVPFSVLFLGWLGLVPFVYAVAMIFSEPGTWPTFGFFDSSPEGGTHILERFGAVILGFMGGCLWGFASAKDRAPSLAFLTATIVPAFIAFIAIQPDPALSCVWLAFGFVILQGIDVVCQRAGVTPDYWLSLRLPLTAGVMTCLLVGALHG